MRRTLATLVRLGLWLGPAGLVAACGSRPAPPAPRPAIDRADQLPAHRYPVDGAVGELVGYAVVHLVPVGAVIDRVLGAHGIAAQPGSQAATAPAGRARPRSPRCPRSRRRRRRRT